jgi:DHA3 family macrolide efflux protein-like MFS transporter
MGLIALFRQAAPRLMWAGQLASATGDRLYAVALTWLTLRLTGSPAAVSLVTLASTLPFLATSVISGALADRHDGLRLARAANITQALMVAVVPVAYLAGYLSLPALAAVACELSALEAFCLPSLQASLPRLVERGWLTPMVSMLDTTDRLARIIGPGAIGLLVVIVPEIHLFTIDAASFAVSALCLTRLTHYTRPPAPLGNERATWLRAARPASGCQVTPGWQVTSGWQVIWQHGALRYAAMLRGAANLAWPAFTIGTPFLVAGDYHRGVGAYGLVLGAFGAGNLAGNALASRIGKSQPLRWCCAAWAVAGSGFVALAAAPDYWPFVLVSAGIGIWTPLANVTIDAHIARAVDQTMLARTYATQRLLVVAAGAAGLPTAALTVSHLGTPAALATAGGFITCAATITACRLPRVSRRPPAGLVK